ncbi:MAG TPA: serine/threonine-protein kinase [Aggregatilineales bacterium]|nr:serine/threonine-protein kinase [Aggregatilineales bacterium]
MNDLVGRRLGQFDILEGIGKGGMATVYRARQASMDRDVAVKVISKDLANSPEFAARFEHEARLIAKLQHAHILPVYDFGREGEIVFLAMRLVDGGSLDQRIREGTLTLEQTVRLFTQIASALTYAHGEGVVHRDLKPNNILMDKSGSPYLTDFGLAKAVQTQTALTATGMVMGTPSYMPPEQWRGESVDGRTDVYALGVMLYEMLTGDLPFKGETPYVLMYKHFDEIPPLAQSKRDKLPDGVNAVIRKAMAKNPADRFASADEMAEAFSAAVGGSAHSTKLSAGRGTEAMQDGQGKGQPDSMPTVRVDKTPDATVQRAAQRPRPRFLFPVLALVALLIIAGVVAVMLTRAHQPYQQLVKLEGHQQPVDALAWSPDGTRIASASEDKTIRIWNATTGDSQFILRGHTDLVTYVAWSRDGKRIASVSEDDTIRLWNPDQGEAVATWQTPGGLGAVLVAWSPDSTRLASLDKDSNVAMWDVQSGTSTTFFKGTFGPKFFGDAMAWSPDGSRLAVAINSNAVTLVDAKTGDTLSTFPAHSDAVLAMAWNSDSSRLATGSADGTVRTWDMTSGSAVPLLSIDAQIASVSAVAWSPDSKRLSSSSGFINLGGTDDLTAHIWDAETGKLLYTLQGHTKPIRQALWNADGTRLATAGLDNVMIVWSTEK